MRVRRVPAALTGLTILCCVAQPVLLAGGGMSLWGWEALDHGFPLSDHVDWPALLGTIAATGAERVLVTHGYREPVVRWLSERGVEAHVAASQWEGELDSEVELPEGESPA